LNEYQTETVIAAQIKTERKKSLGFGKNDLNIRI